MIDHDRRQVLVDGQPVALAPTEYKLLDYLARNRGRVLSRDQILEHVWGWNEDASDNVKVYISTLRQKIEADAQHPRYVVTRRGFGYIFYGGEGEGRSADGDP